MGLLIMKIILTVLLSAIILFGGLVMMVIAEVNGGNFYAAMAFVFTLTVLLFAITQIWGLLKRKIRYLSVLAIMGAMLLSVAGFEINRAYVNSIDEVNEQGVDLTLYEPFREGTKAVSLNEEATLKITDDLPALDGATALYPLYSAFARAVYPENEYPAYMTKENEYVVCTNTANAYNRLLLGNVDIIFVAGPSQEQLQMAKSRGVELKLTPIGREAFVFFVNAKNPVDSLSVSDIQKIYSGEATNWREFGGKNTEIKAFQRPVNSGSQTALIQLMDGIPLMNPPSKDVVSGMGGIISNVSAYKNYNSAIGYSFLFFATEMVKDNKIKLLSLNGIAPTRENVANQTYPYASEFYAVTAGTRNPNAEKLIEWILTEQGQQLVDQTGYTPVNTSKASEKQVKYQRITPDEAQTKMTADAVILDVRVPEEFDAGHIPNAVLLPDYEIGAKAAELLPDKDQVILVYCRSGRRSQAASMELVKMGYTQIYDFGGILDWKGEITR